jgi:hypothetical protein
MAKQKAVEEDIFDVDDTPAGDYDEDSMRKQGEEAAKQALAAGKVEPNPAGAADSIPDYTATPHANAISRDGLGSFSTSSEPDNAMSQVLERLARIERQGSIQEPAPAPRGGGFQYILINEWGGKFTCRGFANLETLQGFAQATDGRKRIFATGGPHREGEGVREFTEVTGLGKPIIRK